jgi:hypothetical protein
MREAALASCGHGSRAGPAMNRTPSDATTILRHDPARDRFKAMVPSCARRMRGAEARDIASAWPRNEVAIASTGNGVSADKRLESM